MNKVYGVVFHRGGVALMRPNVAGRGESSRVYKPNAASLFRLASVLKAHNWYFNFVTQMYMPPLENK